MEEEPKVERKKNEVQELAAALGATVVFINGRRLIVKEDILTLDEARERLRQKHDKDL
jgi:uncharacterized protein YlzI (FlbEa/FlbD family)